jgi:hypothetical protein
MTKSQTPSQIEFKHIIRCCYKSKVASDKIIQGFDNSKINPEEYMKVQLSKIKEKPTYKAFIAMEN